MHEYVTVSSSSYDPASLATKLNEKSAEGWQVVAIVPTGGDVTAFLSREGGMTAAAVMTPAAPMMDEMAPQAEPESMAPVSEPMTEPAGWAVAPAESATPQSSAPATVIQSSPFTAVGAEPQQQQYQAAATPAVPAGWYADPAGRFELRYWDGGTWTEHVSRAGQQYTDAPVA